VFDLKDSKIIHFNSGKRLVFHKYCNSCKQSIGYQLYSKTNDNRLCKSCTHLLRNQPSIVDISSNKNVNFNEFKIIDGKRNYQCYCAKCGVDRGFHLRQRWSNLCNTCTKFGKLKSQETKVKISCIKQDIALLDFVGFTTSTKKIERELFLKKKLHILCFQRDNYTCNCCQVKGGDLHAHHANSWHAFPEQRFELNNLVCLCKMCHSRFHKEYGSKNNTRYQIERFLGNFNES